MVNPNRQDLESIGILTMNNRVDDRVRPMGQRIAICNSFLHASSGSWKQVIMSEETYPTLSHYPASLGCQSVRIRLFGTSCTTTSTCWAPCAFPQIAMSHLLWRGDAKIILVSSKIKRSLANRSHFEHGELSMLTSWKCHAEASH